MFSKVFVLISLFLLACAKPNYQNVSSDLTDANRDLSGCALVLARLSQCVSLTWIQASTDSQMGIFTLDFSQAVASEVKAVLWMPSMGHGSRPTTVTRLSETQFQVSNVAFIMPGEWRNEGRGDRDQLP